MKVKEIVQFLDKRYTKDIASDIDQGKLGLQIGRLDQEVKKILLTLDVTKEVLEEANNAGANFIISHHPFIFFPILSITDENQTGELITQIIKQDICIYNMHTNLDLAKGGVNDSLAEALEIQNIKQVSAEDATEAYIRNGIVPSQTLRDFSLFVKAKLDLKMVKVVGDLNKTIQTVGILGGAGSAISEQKRATIAGCDCYITSEVKHHEALYAKFSPLALIEIPHSAEVQFVHKVKEVIDEFTNKKTDCLITSV